MNECFLSWELESHGRFLICLDLLQEMLLQQHGRKKKGTFSLILSFHVDTCASRFPEKEEVKVQTDQNGIDEKQETNWAGVRVIQGKMLVDGQGGSCGQLEEGVDLRDDKLE